MTGEVHILGEHTVRDLSVGKMILELVIGGAGDRRGRAQ